MTLSEMYLYNDKKCFFGGDKMDRNNFQKISKGVNNAIKKHLNSVEVKSIVDRGQWIRQHYEVTLSNDDIVFLKAITNPKWGGIRHEFNVVNMLHKYNLPAPKILAIDSTCEYIDYPFLIQEKIGGKRMGDLLDVVISKDKVDIYRQLGHFYKKLHSIKGNKSGLWDEDNPMKVKYPISPNEYMFNAEIVNGSGELAYKNGLITREQYNQIIKLTSNNMEYLKDHLPSMVHISPFYWNIYLEKRSQWEVTKILSLGDVMWWDPAYDIATLKYPPFGQYIESYWNAFLEAYGEEPEEKRILLYSILHRLCSSMGVYMEPAKYRNNALKENLSNSLNEIINKIKSL